MIATRLDLLVEVNSFILDMHNMLGGVKIIQNDSHWR